MKPKVIAESLEKPEIRPFTDELQNVSKQFGGFDIDPVDPFGGYVAVDKYASDNLDETQENIQWKVNLKPVKPLDNNPIK